MGAYNEVALLPPSASVGMGLMLHGRVRLTLPDPALPYRHSHRGTGDWTMPCNVTTREPVLTWL